MKRPQAAAGGSCWTSPGVQFADASALGVLERFRTRFAALGGTLELVDPSPRFQRLCRLTGLDGPFRLAGPTAA